jgi:hypothetical protein
LGKYLDPLTTLLKEFAGGLNFGKSNIYWAFIMHCGEHFGVYWWGRQTLFLRHGTFSVGEMGIHTHAHTHTHTHTHVQACAHTQKKKVRV